MAARDVMGTRFLDYEVALSKGSGIIDEKQVGIAAEQRRAEFERDLGSARIVAIEPLGSKSNGGYETWRVTVEVPMAEDKHGASRTGDKGRVIPSSEYPAPTATVVATPPPAEPKSTFVDPGDSARTDDETNGQSEDDADGEPSEKWTVAQIDAYARENGIDFGDASLKADKLEAVRRRSTTARAGDTSTTTTSTTTEPPE